MIYFDHSAATPVCKEVMEKMLPYFSQTFANPSSIYRIGRMARSAVDMARSQIAAILGCAQHEVFFTSGGTESNNWALFGISQAYNKKHFITTKAEHHSVLSCFEELERRGSKVTYLPVDKHGVISLEDLEHALCPETLLASFMYANNEIGSIEHISQVAKLLHARGVFLHTDACQAGGYLDLHVQNLGVDLMTLNGGKIYGPKGSGVLYIRKGVRITPLHYGGEQEHRLRSGTENVAAIVGFAEALRIACSMASEETRRLLKLRKILIEGLFDSIPGVKLNGHPEKRLPNNVHIAIPGVVGESLLLRLDMEGFCVSAGSACASGSLEPSHVLRAIGLSDSLARSSIRITLGRENTEEEIRKFLFCIDKIVQSLLSI